MNVTQNRLMEIRDKKNLPGDSILFGWERKQGPCLQCILQVLKYASNGHRSGSSNDYPFLIWAVV